MRCATRDIQERRDNALRFSARVVAFVALQLGMIFALTDWRLEDEPGYLAATVDKHRRATAVASPRVFLVGGCSVAFGFDSAVLESALERDVVNLGLVAGLGLRYFLNEVERLAQPGDWVILSPEYTAWYGGRSTKLMRQLLEVSPTRLRDLPARDAFNIVDQHGLGVIGGWLRRAVGLRTESVDLEGGGLGYRRADFDERGDYVRFGKADIRFEDLEPDHPWRLPASIQPVDAELLRELSRFVSRSNARGLRVFHLCPPHPADLLAAEREVVQANLEVVSRTEGLVMLGTPEDQVFPLHQFYDARYHLTREGAQVRTKRLSAMLRGLPVFLDVD